MINEVNFLDRFKKDEDDLQSILKYLGLEISGIEGHWRVISKKGKTSAIAFSDRDIPFVLMDQSDNIVNKSGNPDGAKKFLQNCLSVTYAAESVLNVVDKILNGKPVRKAVFEMMDMYGMDDSFFTKEELIEFAIAVEDDVNEYYKSVNSPFSIGYSGVWLEDDDRTVTIDFVCFPNESNYSASIKIDMRAIKAPNDLFKYVDKMTKEIKDIVEKEEVAY